MSAPPNTYAIAVLGPDRPGIIAGITEVLLREHGNLEDSAMTILHEMFTMTLVVSTPATIEEVRTDLGKVADRLGLVVSIRDVTSAAAVTTGDPHVVRVHGADRPGLVYDVTSALAAHDVNITDLATRLVGGTSPTYVMHVHCDIPETTSAATVREDLAVIATRLGIHLTLQPADSDEL